MTSLTIIHQVSYLNYHFDWRLLPNREFLHDKCIIDDKTTGDISGTEDIVSPADKIAPVENGQNHAQKPATGDTGGIGDILSTSDIGFESRPADENMNNAAISTYNCYYCTSFKTDIQKDYEKHVIFSHPEKPCYPSKADLEKLGVKHREDLGNLTMV